MFGGMGYAMELAVGLSATMYCVPLSASWKIIRPLLKVLLTPVAAALVPGRISAMK
jgi:hypothetical protein